MSKVNRVQEALVKNREALTSKQISARFGLANPRDAIYTIRRRGYIINLNQHIDNSNRTKNKYNYTTNVNDTRALIAAGYKAQTMMTRPKT